MVTQAIAFVGTSSDAVLVGYDEENADIQLIMYLNDTDYGALRDFRLYTIYKSGFSF